MSNQKTRIDSELNDALAEARKNRICWWNWYNSLSAEQIYSHYTRRFGVPIKQQYNEEVQQLSGVRQMMEELEELKERVKDETQK